MTSHDRRPTRAPGSRRAAGSPSPSPQETGGLPELDIAAESGIVTYSDHGMHGIYEATGIHQDSVTGIG